LIGSHLGTATVAADVKSGAANHTRLTVSSQKGNTVQATEFGRGKTGSGWTKDCRSCPRRFPS